MKHLKNIILVVATAIILILMTATIVESSKGTTFVRQHIYTSGWFVVLWGIFAIAAAIYCHRHLHWRHLGKRKLGALLELGLERNMGTDNNAYLLGPATCRHKMAEEGAAHAPIHVTGLPQCTDDLFWCKLFSQWHALVCLTRHHVALTRPRAYA